MAKDVLVGRLQGAGGGFRHDRPGELGGAGQDMLLLVR